MRAPCTEGAEAEESLGLLAVILSKCENSSFGKRLMTDSDDRTLAYPGAHILPPTPTQAQTRSSKNQTAGPCNGNGPAMAAVWRDWNRCAGCGGQRVPKAEHSHSLLYRDYIPRCCGPRVCRCAEYAGTKRQVCTKQRALKCSLLLCQ